LRFSVPPRPQQENDLLIGLIRQQQHERRREPSARLQQRLQANLLYLLTICE
jgi:hypothetical protein